MNFDFNLHPGKKITGNKIPSNVNKPLITIITPFFNSGAFLETTANCVFNQTFPFFEWIIINDGSTNNKDIELLEELERKDHRVSIYHKENGGISSARNLGIQKASTEIIVSLDADDLIDPTFLECGFFTLYTNPEASWCYTDSVGFGNLEYLWKKEFDSEVLKKENFLIEIAMIRRSALIQVGCYDETEKHFFEDWHLWLKLLREKMFPVHMSYYGSWYRRVDDGVLGLVRNHSEKYKRAMDIIEEVAYNIKQPIKAIEFPILNSNNFENPKTWVWDRNAILDDSKCNVLCLFPWLSVGGADKFNLDLISRINQNEFNLSIITTVPSDNVWRQKFEQHTSNIFDLTSFLHTKDWASFIHYFIKSRKIHVLFVSNSYYGYYLIPWLKQQFPYLKIVDYVHMEEWYWRKGGFARISSVISPYIDKTYVCTNHLKEVLTTDFNRNRNEIEIVYINVDIKHFNIQSQTLGKIRKELNLEENVPVVLFPCRIHPQKRPFLMLKIAKLVRDKIPNIKFWVVGDGPDLPKLIQQADVDGLNETLQFLGNREDMAAIYADADLTLVCSIKEGLSLTSYESLALGTPVISADVGGQKELIDETVGRLVPLSQDEISNFSSSEFVDEEVALYAESIVEILSDADLYKQLQVNARQKIEADFNIVDMIKRMESEFISLKSDKKIKKLPPDLVSNLSNELLLIYNEFNGMEWLLQNSISEDHTKELRSWVTHLEEGKTWLESKYVEHEEIIRDLKEWITMLETGKEWLEGQLEQRDKELLELKEKDAKRGKIKFFR
ncbi:glycosyltransferase [Paenibacillus sp. AK121]|uniref:glycosyltransferase n=1 Tax=Paenibacillus TaxID=44249 RepID=UPI000FAFD135|nr:glycosyltransferase [Paenibacillus sp. AK121]MBU9706507.1 glycosyltransferase [Paenibacillus sp. AK121]MEE4570969.1 glycosyltransferase [Paenibacillus polymyxa]